MATPQKGESSGIIGTISKFAGAAVGTAVITGKRIVGSATPPSKGTSGRATRRAPAKIKKKVVKRKPAGSASKSGASRKKPAQSPVKKKKKSATPRKKTKRRKTKKKTAKSKVSGHSKDGLTPKTGTEINMLIEKQKSQLQIPIAEAETIDKDITSTNVSPKKSTGKKGATRSRKSSIPIIEYNDKAGKAVVPAASAC
ncbi:MAG: hypothetical protein ACYSYU_09465 [Planctomycetota bacterium]|jgi:hypothetical protein